MRVRKISRRNSLSLILDTSSLSAVLRYQRFTPRPPAWATFEVHGFGRRVSIYLNSRGYLRLGILRLFYAIQILERKRRKTSTTRI